MNVKLQNKDRYIVGVISDTHGTIRDTVATAFENVDLILHAGDIGTQDALHKLEQIAPVAPVRGNMDSEMWADTIPNTQVVEIGEMKIFIIHDHGRYHGNWAEAGYDIVIFGHTHNQHFEEHEGIYFLNPGCAGNQTANPTAVLLQIRGASCEPEFISLK